MKQTFILFFLLFATVLPAVSQPTQHIRAELPADRFASEFTVIPLPDSAAIVLNHDGHKGSEEQYTFLKFNAALAPVWQQPAPLPRGTELLKAKAENQVTYFLFETYSNSDYLLVRLNTITGSHLISKHKLPERTTFQFSDFKVLNGLLFLTGTQNGRFVALLLNPTQETLDVLPATYEQSSSLAYFYPDTTTNRLEFVLNESNGLVARLQVKRLKPDGTLVSTNFLQHQRQSNLLDARLTPGDSLQKLLIGTYSLRDFNYSQGFFTGGLMASANQQFTFYDFTNFQHYFDYLKPNRKQRIRTKILKIRENKKDYYLRHRMLLHELRPFQDGYIMTGEMYFPHYQPMSGGGRVFDGYQFFQSIVCAFDKAGKLKWENSFPLRNLVFMDLQETVSVGAEGNRVILCYPEEEKIHYKIMAGNHETPNDSVTTVLPALPNEKLLSTNQDGVSYWYGSHFLAFGTQEIKGITGRRRVFYLNKLSF